MIRKLGLVSTIALVAALGGCAMMPGMGPGPDMPPAPAPVSATAPVEYVRDIHSHARPEIARVKHVALDLAADFATGTLSGTGALDITAEPGATEIILDVRNLDIQDIRDGAGAPLQFQTGDNDPILGQPLTNAHRHVLVESAMIAEARQEQLQRLGFDDGFVGRVIDHDMREIRLARNRAQRREFRDRETDQIIDVLMRVLDTLQHGLVGRCRKFGLIA